MFQALQCHGAPLLPLMLLLLALPLLIIPLSSVSAAAGVCSLIEPFLISFSCLSLMIQSRMLAMALSGRYLYVSR